MYINKVRQWQLFLQTCLLYTHIHPQGVDQLLSGLKSHKASGPDMIPTYLLKLLAHQLAPVLTLLYQDSLDQGQLPVDWKQLAITNVLPIFKKSNQSLLSNYQPISLTSICWKVMEHIVYSNILHAPFSKIYILCKEQHGFRSCRSCETQLLNTIDDLAKNLNDRKQTDVILLDFSKAFDKVPNHYLCLKLSDYGIHNGTLFWIENFLTGRK